MGKGWSEYRTIVGRRDTAKVETGRKGEQGKENFEQKDKSTGIKLSSSEESTGRVALQEEGGESRKDIGV